MNETKASEKLEGLASPVPQSDPVSPRYVKQIIKQAFFLWRNKNTVNEEDVNTPELAEYTGEALYSLLVQGEEYQDWGDALQKYAFFMIDLLVLLAKPDVLNQLPEYRRGDAGELLSRMHEFFTSMNYEGNFPFLDYAFCDYANGKQLENKANYYDFAKRYNSSYLIHFFSAAYEASNDRNRQAVYDRFFKK